MEKKIKQNKKNSKDTGTKNISASISKINKFNFVYRYAYIFIILACVLVYCQTLSFGLVFCDDMEIIQRNWDRIKDISNIFSEFGKGYMATDYYRPVVQILFIIAGSIGGQNPFIYHFFNLLFHTLFCISLFYFLKELNFNKKVTFYATILYAIHPLFSNAVSWIVGINDLSVGLFGLLSFIFLIKLFKNYKLYFLILHLLFLLLAVFSKEAGLFFPIIFVSYIYLFYKEYFKSKKFISLIVSWGVIEVLFLFLRHNAKLGTPVYTMGFKMFIYNLRYIPEIISKFYIPYNYSTLPVYTIFSTVIGLIIIVVFGVSIFVNRKKLDKLVILGIIWFLVLSIPLMIFSITNYYDWNDYLECRSYFGSLGLLLMTLSLFNLTAFKVFENNKILMIIIIIVFSITTLNISKDYENSNAFFSKAVEKGPKRLLFHFYLGIANKDQKDLRIPEKYFLDALKINKNYMFTHLNLGTIYYKMHRYDEAIKYYNNAIMIDSACVIAYDNLIVLYRDTRRYSEAVPLMEAAITHIDKTQDIQFSLIRLLFKLDRLDEAYEYSKSYIKKYGEQKEVIKMYLDNSKTYYINNKKDIADLLFNRAREFDTMTVNK